MSIVHLEENCLDRHAHGEHANRFKHDLIHALSSKTGRSWSAILTHRREFGARFLHNISIRDDTMLVGILQSQDTTLALRHGEQVPRRRSNEG